MTDHEKCAGRLSLWTPGMKCAGCMDPHGHRFVGEADGEPIIESHDIPCPPLTSDEISEWLRKEDMYISVTYHEWDYIDRCSKYIVGIWDRWHGKMFSNGEGPTMLAALENAVAKLPETKE